jgi:hypothetical protein
MLNRPTRADRRHTDALRQRRHRARARNATMPVQIEITADAIDLLIRTGWLIERECCDKAKIARAIELMLADSARHTPEILSRRDTRPL